MLRVLMHEISVVSFKILYCFPLANFPTGNHPTGTKRLIASTGFMTELF